MRVLPSHLRHVAPAQACTCLDQQLSLSRQGHLLQERCLRWALPKAASYPASSGAGAGAGLGGTGREGRP